VNKTASPANGRPPGFVYRKTVAQNGARLSCEQISLGDLADRYGTPLYVYSSQTIHQRVLAFREAFRQVPHRLCYSVKANSNIHLLRILADLGCAFDVVSGGELQRVHYASRKAAHNVVFSGVGKTSGEMQAAVRAGILLFNVESESELSALARVTAKLKKTARVALRVNPDVPADTHPYISTGLREHKFGIPIRQAMALYTLAARHKFLEVAGVSVHIGSQITDARPFRAAMERVAALVRGLRKQGHRIRYVDAGGGLGISYSQAQDAENYSHQVTLYAKAVLEPLRDLGVELLLEPGRAIIGSAGVLLTRVLYRKQNSKKRFLVVDAAMNDLIRPSLYHAHHEILTVQTRPGKNEMVDIVGPVCETGDFLARDRKLAGVQEGDLLAVMDCGAYGMALSSNYNSRLKAPEILVRGKTAKLIRRRDSFADLVRNEI
jgi:diaminopimelate decarboxylase